MHRRRLLNRATSGLAIVSVALLVNGCEAEVRGAPPDTPESPGATVVAPQAPPPALPQATLPAPPQAPPTEPTAPFDGLDARVSQATADAADSGADIEVMVLDRTTGQSVSNGVTRPYPTASVVKLFIADDLLLQEAEGKTQLSPADRQSLDIMLRSSDDGAAQMFWDRSGGNAIIARVKERYGLASTIAPYNGHWDVTQTTAGDLVRYYDMLLDGTGGLPPEQANVIISNLKQSTPTGTDGYPQRFGIPEGLYAEQVGVKQGWFCCWNGANQLHLSTGVIGPDNRYVMAIGSLDPTSADEARQNITQAVKTMFPTGRI